jgi:hypothetical protein
LVSEASSRSGPEEDCGDLVSLFPLALPPLLPSHLLVFVLLFLPLPYLFATFLIV